MGALATPVAYATGDVGTPTLVSERAAYTSPTRRTHARPDQPADLGFSPRIRPDGVGKCSGPGCPVVAVLWVGRCIACFEKSGGEWGES